MVILKWVIDEEWDDGDNGHDCTGHYEELELTEEQIDEAVKDHLRFELHVDEKFNVDQLYDDLKSRITDMEEAYADEIASYYGGTLK